MEGKVKQLFMLNMVVSIVTLLAVLANYYMTYYTLMQVEYTKVGGQDNYALLQKLQLQQVKQAVDYYKSPEGKAQLDQLEAGSNTNTDTTVPTTQDNTINDISALKEGYFVQGNQNADISWIEYSDLECPYCKKFHDSKVRETVMEKYKDQINYMFKSFPLEQLHQNAKKEAEALECVGEQKGADAYFSMIHTLFTAPREQGKEFDIAKLPDLVKGIGLDGEKFSACLDSGKYSDKIVASMAEGQQLGITGTPTTLLLNNKTGKYEIISGAQGEATFDAAITKLLGK